MMGRLAPGLRGLLCRRMPAAHLLAVVILVFVPVNFLYNAVLTKIEPPEKNDFTSYFVAAHVLREGMGEALYYPEPVGSLLAQASVQKPWADVAASVGVTNPNYYLYPPLFAVAMLPLTFLSYGAAFAAWMGVNLVFLGGALWATMRGRGRIPAPAWAASILIAGLFYPVWRHLKIGQSSLLVLVLLAAALALLRKGRDLSAGAALSGAILLKLTPAVLLLLLAVRRRWRAVWAAAAGIGLLSALSAAAVGWEAQTIYFTKMVPLLSAGTAFYPNQSLNGFLARLLNEGDDRKADLLAGSAPSSAAAAAGLVVIAISLAAAWRRRRDGSDEALEDGFVTFVLASLLVSPISWEHHYVMALIPAWLLALRMGSAEGSRTRAAASGTALALIGSYVGVNVFEKFGPGPIEALLSSAGLLGGLILWGLFVSSGAPGGAIGGSGPAVRREGGAVEPEAGASRALLLLIGLFAGIQFLFKVAEYNTSFRYGDFTSYYLAAAVVAEGRPEALYEPGTPDDVLAKSESPSAWRSMAETRGVRDANFYLYPPFFAILVTPLALLPYDRARDAWYLLNLAMLGAFLVWYVRSGRAPPASAEKAAALVLTALLWPALFTFGAGQANYAILLLIFGALIAAERGRHVVAGISLAAAAAIKITPALLVAYFLWKGRYRIFGWAAAAFAAIGALSVATVGWETNRIYLVQMAPLLSRGCAHWVNQSIPAFLSRLSGAGMFDWSLAPSSAFVRIASAAAALAIVAAIATLTRPGAVRASVRLEYALVLLATILVSPLSWVHHAVLALPALLLLARHLIETGRSTLGRALLLGASFTLFGIYFKPPGFFQAPLLTPMASYQLAGLLILGAMIAVEIHRLRQTGQEGAA